jgi:hypothetical protein
MAARPCFVRIGQAYSSRKKAAYGLLFFLAHNMSPPVTGGVTAL